MMLAAKILIAHSLDYVWRLKPVNPAKKEITEPPRTAQRPISKSNFALLAKAVSIVGKRSKRFSGILFEVFVMSAIL
jgi:hypothetical protein